MLDMSAEDYKTVTIGAEAYRHIVVDPLQRFTMVIKNGEPTTVMGPPTHENLKGAEWIGYRWLGHNHLFVYDNARQVVGSDESQCPKCNPVKRSRWAGVVRRVRYWFEPWLGSQ